MINRIQAYAKINLFLDVTAIREDGYHDIQSVMQSVSLCDTVDISLEEGNAITVECSDARVPCGEKNIAYRAAKLFLSVAGLSYGVKISIKKNIPMAAGLAGGSADAAAVLVGLNLACENPFSVEELCEIGKKLGADVPFCIRCGCSYLEGIGEIFYPFPELPSDVFFVIACGGEGVSTPEAYRLLDEKYDRFSRYEPRGVQPLRESLSNGDERAFCKELFNIFEEPVASLRGTVLKLKELMLSAGAEASMMSGSGPSVFGVFFKKEDAEKAVGKILQEGCFAVVATPISKRIFER